VNPTLIVCSIEFSSAGKAALAHALDLARWYDAELHAVHVRAGRRGSAASGANHPSYRRLVAFIDGLNPEGVAVTPKILAGDPVSAVAEYARHTRADLVVVPQYGRRASGYWSAGAFATAIGRAVGCPTIAVPDRAQVPAAAEAHPLFRSILCAIDFSDESMRASNEAVRLAQQSAGRLTLLHVVEGFPGETVYSGGRAVRLIDEYRARVERRNAELHLLVPPAALNWCDVEAETVSGVPHGAIVAAAKARQSDLIVMGLPRQSRLDRIVTGSTVKRVLRRAPCPVLMVPGPTGVSAGVFHSTADGADEHRVYAPAGAAPAAVASATAHAGGLSWH
jgi:nucleotide-binding universal stress UspA family protein